MRALVHRMDTKLTESITSWPAMFQPLFLVVTLLGHPVVTVSIGTGIIVVGWLQSNTPLIASGGMIWVALAAGSLLKLAFGRARPLTEYAANIWLDKLSFPSGHTTGSTIAYGLLAYFAGHILLQPWNYIVVTSLTSLIILIGLSRVYLGAHFPSDVIAGWLLGGAALLVATVFVGPLGGI